MNPITYYCDDCDEEHVLEDETEDCPECHHDLRQLDWD